MAGLSADSWVDMQVRNSMGTQNDLTFKNAHHESGEFLESVGSPNPISDEDVNHLVARPRHLTHIVACSHHGDPAGTSGGYDVFDGDRKVCHVLWTCPLNRGVRNTLDVLDLDTDYEVEVKGANLDPGPIGHVSIKIQETGTGGSP